MKTKYILRYRNLLYFSFGLAFIILFANNTIAQDNSIKLVGKLENCNEIQLTEKIILHTDRTTYVTNEKIWFKAYYLNDCLFQIKNLSKVLYVELKDEKGQLVSKGKFPIDEGVATGFLSIPSNTIMGNCTLIAYTKWLQNFGKQSFIKKNITILNPKKKISLKRNEKRYERKINIKSKDVLKIKLETEKKEYSNREKVTVKIKTSGKNGNNINANLSLSITKNGTNNNIYDSVISDSSDKNLNRFIIEKGKTSLNGDNRKLLVPETRGIIISGIVKSQLTNNPLTNKKIYISLLGKQIEIQNSTTNNSGRFYFAFDELYGKNDFVIQLEDNSEEYKIIIDFEYSEETGKIKYPIYPVPAKKDLYENLIRNNSIELHYKKFKKKIAKKGISQSINFYEKADSTYLMDKFITLPTMEDVFFEVIGNVRVKKRNGKYVFHILPNKTNIPLQIPPLVMVDGVPIFHYEEILKTKPTLIKRIDIINSYYLLGNTKYGGIISLITKKGKFANISLDPSLLFLEYDMYNMPEEFQQTVYQDKISKNSRIPDFRNTLHWNPSVKTDDNGDAQISFYTSDEDGTYIITVKGVSYKGMYGNQQSSFKVTDY